MIWPFFWAQPVIKHARRGPVRGRPESGQRFTLQGLQDEGENAKPKSGKWRAIEAKHHRFIYLPLGCANIIQLACMHAAFKHQGALQWFPSFCCASFFRQSDTCLLTQSLAFRDSNNARRLLHLGSGLRRLHLPGCLDLAATCHKAHGRELKTRP